MTGTITEKIDLTKALARVQATRARPKKTAAQKKMDRTCEAVAASIAKEPESMIRQKYGARISNIIENYKKSAR